MNTVTVLIEGYANVNPDNTWNATSSTTLIETGGHKIIVDPGCHRRLLLSALKKSGLRVGDIDIVFVSHYHPDHCLLMGIFPNAIVYDSVQYQKGPIGGETGDHLPGTDIQVIKTPGHAPEHASLLVPTAKGRVLIAADVFWWPEGVEQIVDINSSDEFASDTPALMLSRSHALQLADFIIPGHGRMFPVAGNR